MIHFEESIVIPISPSSFPSPLVPLLSLVGALVHRDDGGDIGITILSSKCIIIFSSEVSVTVAVAEKGGLKYGWYQVWGGGCEISDICCHGNYIYLRLDSNLQAEIDEDPGVVG